MSLPFGKSQLSKTLPVCLRHHGISLKNARLHYIIITRLLVGESVMRSLRLTDKSVLEEERPSVTGPTTDFSGSFESGKKIRPVVSR